MYRGPMGTDNSVGIDYGGTGQVRAMWGKVGQL